VGGGLALVAAASLAVALLLRGHDSSPGARSAAAEPRETIVSTLSPAPAKAAPPARAPAPTKPVCANCAVVESVTAIERGERPSGLGAVAGAVAGHAIEKRVRTTTEYRVRVKMADGSTRTLSHPTRVSAGEPVRVEGDRLVLAARPVPAATPSTATRTAERTETPARPRSMAEAKRL
jgi:hypothetical protein